MVRELLVQATERELRQLLDGERDTLRVNETLDAPDSTPLGEVELDDVVSVVGVVTDIGQVNTFSRDDGSEGQVCNITIQDRTGMIEVALWGDTADRALSVGDTVQVLDGEVESGYKDSDKQLNAGGETRLRIFEQERDAQIVTLRLEADR